MNYSLESFIDFCDDYQISQEGFGNALKWIKDKLKSMILRLIQFIRRFTSNNKGYGIRYKLDGLLKRLENKLTAVDKINTTQEAKKVEEEVNEIKEEVEKIVGEDDEEFNLLDEREVSNTKDIEIMKRSKSGNSKYFIDYIIYNMETFDKICDMIENMIDAKEFSEYIKIFKEFKSILQLPNKCTVYNIDPQIKTIDNKEVGALNCYYILEDSRPMKRNINDILYHTSKDPNLKSITPRWISELSEKKNRLGIRYNSARFFDTPRAFFGVKPMNRLGGKIDGQDLYIYKAEGIKNAFIDIDGIKYGTSVYVEGFSDIPLTRIDNK